MAVKNHRHRDTIAGGTGTTLETESFDVCTDACSKQSEKASNLDEWTQTVRRTLSRDVGTLKENDSVKSLAAQRRRPVTPEELTVVAGVVQGGLLVGPSVLLGSYRRVGGRAAACPHC